MFQVLLDAGRTRASSRKAKFLPSEVVKKRTLHHFMSTGATEKSLHSFHCAQ